MTTRRLLESDVTLIEAHLKTALPGILTTLRLQRGDAAVTTEPPLTYLRYPKAVGYRLPAVFIISQAMDLQQQAKGGNYVTGLTTLNVSVLIEDQNADKLTTKAFRYAAALHEALEQTILSSTDQAVKIFIRVERIENSPLYADSAQEEKTRFFRKEVVLYCKVEHTENY